MQFLYADSHDYVDPRFDFIQERYGDGRIPQRDDCYAHELFPESPYDGLLVSLAVVMGSSGQGRYTSAQRERFLREGAHRFLRFPPFETDDLSRYMIMGDCGAFAYARREVPPFTVPEVSEFYAQAGFTHGVSIDHIIMDFNAEYDAPKLVDTVPEDHRRRYEVTLRLAEEFLAYHRANRLPFVPMGVAQGWSPNTYKNAVRRLVEIGYDWVALGGMVPLRTPDIRLVLEAVAPELESTTHLHLFGVARTDYLHDFARLGVQSFDSTSPLRQAFKDSHDNYHTIDNGNYVAVRIPQAGSHIGLKKKVLAGRIDQREVFRLERQCLDSMRAFDQGKASVDEVMIALAEYHDLLELHKLEDGLTRRTLTDRPWKRCPCAICQAIGIDVIMFRGAERNRRRGFHNLWVFSEKMRRSGLRP